MIGKVTIQHEDYGAAIATLDESGNWSFAGHPWLRIRLNVAIAALDLEYHGPQEGPFGIRWLHALQDRVGGKLELEPKEDNPPGVLY